VEDGVEAAGVVAGVITSSIVCDASSGSAAALRGCLTSLVGAAGAVVAAALDLGRDLTCGCLSSLEDGVEAAGVVGRDLTSFVGAAGAVVAAASDLGRGLTSLLILIGGCDVAQAALTAQPAALRSPVTGSLTCGCLSSFEDGVEAAGVGAGVLTSCSGDAASGSAAALRGCLTSLVGAAGAVAAAASDLGRDLTCGCLSSLEGGVEAAGIVAVQYDSFLPYVLIRTALKTSYGDLLLKAFSRAQWTAKRISMGREARV
jgi:hypothetical protein